MATDTDTVSTVIAQQLVSCERVASGSSSEDANIPIYDIRRGGKEISLVNDISQGLKDSCGTGKELPTLLLYDENGLKLFEDITYLDEYYLTNEEIEVLRKNADQIADQVLSNTVLVEMGSGNLRKITILLDAIERQCKKVQYYALDVNLSELERTLADVPTYKYVECLGLLGTYDDGFEWLKNSQVSQKRKIVMTLGSSIGNFLRQDAMSFIKSCAEAAGQGGYVLVAIDSCLEKERVYHAYNDHHDVTHKFTLNGLKHANTLLGKAEFDLDMWQAAGRYDDERRCHQAFVTPKNDTTVLGTSIKAGEMIRIEESYKYSDFDISLLWEQAGVKQSNHWTNERGDYAMYLVTKNPYAQPWDPLQFAAEPVPSWTEWERLWQLWDTVTRHMIPDEQLLAKPIKLRNACIFYLGHIPTFFDMKLTDATNGSPTEPGYYYSIFERGIDPDVENPEQCHAHSEVPNEWPALQDILSYQKRVRERVKKLYEEGMDQNAKIGRCLWLGYEHEAMHLETLLYMLIQSEKTLPPTGVPVPVWSVRADQAEKSAVPNEWITIPARNIVINLDDPENGSTYPRYYGWDIEKPARKAQVNTFAAKARPITIGEYAYYMVDEGLKEVPASWAISEDGVSSLKDFNREFKAGLAHSSALGSRDSLPMSFLQNKYVRTVFGAVPLADALTWPVSASYDELRGCAAYMGGRIPTLEEARSMYAHASELKCKSTQSVEERLGRTIPAVNSHLVNDGVEESPPSKGPQSGSAGNPQELFVNLKGCNVGFQNWHPTPIVEKGSGLCGQGDMGGVWEWTSTTLAKYDGYKPMPLYPAYSQDFFDGKHNIVLGGSWATVPRIAGRKTFINWYQRNYPYVWAGARVVKDI